jgi:hypothetical protein
LVVAPVGVARLLIVSFRPNSLRYDDPFRFFAEKIKAVSLRFGGYF